MLSAGAQSSQTLHALMPAWRGCLVECAASQALPLGKVQEATPHLHSHGSIVQTRSQARAWLCGWPTQPPSTALSLVLAATHWSGPPLARSSSWLTLVRSHARCFSSRSLPREPCIGGREAATRELGDTGVSEGGREASLSRRRCVAHVEAPDQLYTPLAQNRPPFCPSWTLLTGECARVMGRRAEESSEDFLRNRRRGSPVHAHQCRSNVFSMNAPGPWRAKRRGEERNGGLVSPPKCFLAGAPFGPGMEAWARTARRNCMCRGGMLCYRMVHERTLYRPKTCLSTSRSGT